MRKKAINGLGFDLSLIQSIDDTHSLSFEYFKMDDSYNKDAIHMGFTYTYSPSFDNIVLDSINYKLSLMHMNRTFRYLTSSDGNYDYSVYELREESMIVPLPYLSITPSDYFEVDLMYIPNLNKKYEPDHIFFCRLGLNLTEITNRLID